MRTCPNCGAVVENDNAKFCKKCGKPLPPVIKPSGQSVPPVNTNSNYNPNDEATLLGGYQNNGMGISLGGNDSLVTPPPVGNQYSPGSTVPSPSMERPKQYLLAAILSTLFCCLPTGIYAIFCSTKIDTFYEAGDYDMAEMYSEKARKWSLYPAIVMTFVYVLVGIFCVIALSVEQ